MHVPLQNALLKKLDVTTNERRFAQEIKMVERNERYASVLSVTNRPLDFSDRWFHSGGVPCL